MANEYDKFFSEINAFDTKSQEVYDNFMASLGSSGTSTVVKDTASENSLPPWQQQQQQYPPGWQQPAPWQAASGMTNWQQYQYPWQQTQ